MTLTYQTRVVLDEKQQLILSEYSSLMNHVEHALYAKIAKGVKSTSCKTAFLKKYEITARQFNAIRVSLDGKIKACLASRELALESLKQKIDCVKKHIQKFENKPSKRFVLHQKKRRKEHLMQRLSSIEKKQDIPNLCFGGKKLFRAQFHLEKNGFLSHEAWREAWKAKRESEFFILGSKDETAGNQTCTARVREDGKLVLRLRLPNSLIKKFDKKYIEIDNVFFAYGQDAVLASLYNPDGQALTYRFKKDKKGWRVFVSTDLKKQERVCREGQGVIGIDLNCDHIALVETDRFGNLIKKEVISWISHGKTKHQLKALTGDVCKSIINKALEAKKPIVIEKLDFQKKKLNLKEEKSSFARLLSSFAYGSFFSFLKARAYKEGITIYQVNPAFTSVIGSVNYAKRYGLSSHLAAALCIARRYQKFSESPCYSSGEIPDGKGSHVAFVLPERNRTKHVWHFWKEVKKKAKAKLAAYFRAIKDRSLSSKTTLETTSRLLKVEFLYANRQQNCLADVAHIY